MVNLRGDFLPPSKNRVCQGLAVYVPTLGAVLVSNWPLGNTVKKLKKHTYAWAHREQIVNAHP